uniref:Uncharacterized protein n=1 Tax=Aegilops tauschii subsp. strangulata TaxID=200361 RepID=A0A453I586_AEGTS
MPFAFCNILPVIYHFLSWHDTQNRVKVGFVKLPHILNLIYELRSVVHSDLYWTNVEQSGDCSLHLLEYMPMQYSLRP